MRLSRRKLFWGVGGCMVAAPLRRAVAFTPDCSPVSVPSPPVRVNEPRKVKSWELPAERIPLGVPDDYKPTIALLPDGRLMMTAVMEVDLPGKKYYFETHSWESADGGRTWSARRKLEGVQGHEPYLSCTSKGTLFLTTTMLLADPNNREGRVYMALYRSTDRGQTWSGRNIILRGAERGGAPPEYASMCSRCPLEMPDGTLLFGVSIQRSSIGYLWRSSDGGRTWEQSQPVKIGQYRGVPWDNWDAFFDEDFTFLNSAGTLLHFVRCGPPSPMYPMNDGRTTPTRDDSGDRMMMCTSSDGGLTWSDLRDCGDYGTMYPRVLRLRDGRLMMTYTQRSLSYPIGLRAVFSEDEGATWQFHSDQITIEGKTPWGMPQGGGFGNTVQLQDGGLVSCSSYRGFDNKTHVEVVRWRL